MTRRELIAAIGTVVLTSTVAAQTAPNFAGTWTPDREKTQAAMTALGAPAAGGTGTRMVGGAGGGTMSPSGAAASPLEWTITQTATAITLMRPLPDGSAQKFTYKLAGESVNVNARTTLTTKSRWEGGKLVTEGTQVTTTDQGPIDGTFKETRWLDKDGSMHVETVRALSGNAPATVASVLSRKAK